MLKNNVNVNTFKIYLVFIFLALLSIIRFSVSDLIPVNWDGPIFIDGSYRVYLGQIPNKDFSVPIGPLIFLAGGLGMSISTPSILGMNLGLILFSLMISLVFIFLLLPDIKKKIKLTDIIFFLVFFLLLFSPKILGGKALNLAYTGLYNNLCYAVFMGVIYFLHASSDCQDNKRNFLLGFIVGLLIFIKLVFFLAVALITFLFLARYRKKRILSFIFGMFFLIILMALIEGGLSNFLKDQVLVSSLRMQENPYFSFERLWNYIKHTWVENFIFIVMLWFAYKKIRPYFYIGVLLFIVEYFLSMAIMQKPVHMTSMIFALILMRFAESQDSYKYLGSEIKSKALCIFLFGKFLIGSVIWIPFMLSNLTLPTFDVKQSKNVVKNSISKHIHSWNFDQYVADCNNYCGEILVVGQNNIYNFYLGIQPASGGLLYWQKGVTFSKKLIENENYFIKDKILRNVDRVILAKGFHHESSKEFINIYHDQLKNNFSLIVENDQASIYIKVK